MRRRSQPDEHQVLPVKRGHSLAAQGIRILALFVCYGEKGKTFVICSHLAPRLGSGGSVAPLGIQPQELRTAMAWTIGMVGTINCHGKADDSCN